MHTPFKWGENDCCTFACDIIELKHGVDHMAHVRGSYSSEAGAKKVLIKHFGSMSEGFSNVISEIDPTYIQMCDLALLDTASGKSMALFFGGSYWMIGEHGLITLNGKDPVIKAWRI